MMRSAHANLDEEAEEEWPRRKFTTCQVNKITFSAASEEVPTQDSSSGGSTTRAGVQEELSQQDQLQADNSSAERTSNEDNRKEHCESNQTDQPEDLQPGIVRQFSGPRKNRMLEKRVSFPSDESQLVKNLEPPTFDIPEVILSEFPEFNPIDSYTLSCQKNATQPVDSIVEQLKNIDLGRPRSNSLTLKGLTLDSRDCESLEDVLKNIPLKTLDLTESNPDEEGLVALFDMIEFYEAATHVSIAANRNMSSRGWQACCRMIKRSECLESLDAARIALSEHTSTLLARALRSNSRLRVLFLNRCGLHGRPFCTIASSLKLNHHLRELHLAENNLSALDALQLSILLTGNDSIQHVDLRNNDIQDQGMIYLCDALLDNTGLNTLIVWNNGITHGTASALAKVLVTNKTLQTLNLGHNSLGDEGVIGFAGELKNNRSLLHLGLQENGLTCSGVIGLAESLAAGSRLQRVDLRKNRINLTGIMALASKLKYCPYITQVDLSPVCEVPEEHEEFQKFIGEISKTCSNHAEEKTEAQKEQSTNPLSEAISVEDTKIPRKVSLTCLVPPSESTGLRLPLTPTKEEDETGERVPRKLRSPLPSPMPSPSRSPLPSPSSRFKVTRVEPDAAPLPSPRSRFTVTPVSEYTAPVVATTEPVANRSDADATQDCASLIRSSPSKVVVGFDVLST